jgi:putative oxidoreductase
MSFGENIAPLVGRCMIAAFFVLSGLQKLQNWDSTTLYMAEHGISAIQPLLALSIDAEVGAGLGLVIGFRTRLLALVLFAYTLLVSFQMHDFWTMGESDSARVEAALFAKNMAIAGGLLVLVGLGAGRWSYDSRREE